MQLILTQLFRPRWQHPKPGVRRKAIQRLKPEVESDQRILEELARSDSDAEIRCQALNKLNEPTLFLRQLRDDPDHHVRLNATERLCHWILDDQGSDLNRQARLDWLAQIDDTDLLTHIALRAEDSALQLAAAERLSSENDLENLILNGDSRPLRQALCARIQDGERAARLAKTIRQKDKVAYRILRDTLDREKQREQQQQAQLERARQLCELTEKQARDKVGTGYESLLQQSRRHWLEIDAELPAELAARFEQACRQCESALAQYTQTQALERAAQQRQATRIQLLKKYAADLEALCSGSEPADSAASALSTLKAQWTPLEQDSDAEQRAQFEALQQTLASLCDCLARYHAQADALEALDDSADIDALAALLKAVDWPRELARPESLTAAAERLKQLREDARKAPKAEKTQPQRDETGKLVELLGEAIESGSFQDASRAHKRLRQQLERHPRSLQGAMRARYQKLNARYLELNSWQQFATQPKLEELCEAMEVLAASEQDSAQKAKQLKELQRQWKQLESPALPHALRSRFQAANDRAYQACQDHFEQQRQLRQQNLERRRQILADIEQLSAGLDWDNLELKALHQQLRDAKQQWRDCRPVDHGPGRKLQQSFNRSLKQIETGIEALRDRNTDAKRQLLAEALALLEQPEADTDALARAKQLQQRWKAQGPGHRDQEQALWREFQSACDQLFKRQQQQQRQATDEARQQAEALCQQLEQQPTASGSLASLKQRFQALLATLPGNPALQARFERAHLNAELAQATEGPLHATVERRQQLCEQIEARVAGEDDALDLDALQAAWQQGERPTAPYGELLEQRFSQAVALLDSPDRLADLVDQAVDQLRLLCIRLEIMAGANSPDADQALRMEYQMTRLQEALAQHQHEHDPTAEEIHELELLWRCTPFNQYQPELKQRFAHTLKALLDG